MSISLQPNGDFTLRNAQLYPDVYFPLVNPGGMISSVTPLLAGDAKTDQNTFLLAPASAETLHESRAARNFWVCVEGQGPWSAVGQSAAQMASRFGEGAEEAVLTGGLLWQQVRRTQRQTGLTARTLSFVPATNEHIEIMQVTLSNEGDAPLKLIPVAAIPMYGRSADNIRDHRHVTSLLHRVTLRDYGIDLHPTLTFDERGHRKANVTYRVWGGDDQGRPPEGFIPLVRDFVGSGSYDWPQAVVCPESAKLLHSGDKVQGSEVVAALRFSLVTLLPGEEVRYQIILSVNDDPSPYLTPSAVSKALEDTKAFWQEASALSLKTGDKDFDAWCRWVGIQPMLRRICGCSFLPHHDYGRGGRGWRDLWQDSLALLLKDPRSTRQDLLSYFAGVRTDGTNATIIGSRPGEFKADRNGIPRVWMDHGFWPALTVELYLNETGDEGFLLEEQSYFRDTLPHRGEGTPLPAPGCPACGTVLEHLLTQAVTAFFDVGEHGQMRLRGADWNDGLDMARNRGESVAFTAAYAGSFDFLAARLERMEPTTLQIADPLYRLLLTPPGTPEEKRAALFEYCREMESPVSKTKISAQMLANQLRAMGTHLKEHIRSCEWISDSKGNSWFNSYYDDSGRRVEGATNEGIRMMLTGQVFTLMSGTADEKQAQAIISAAKRYLRDPSRGGYCLNTDFREVKLDMGRMFGFAYGTKENGAVFCHMAVMYAYALYSRGFAKEGWEVLELLFRQCMDFDRCRVLPGIPEYFDDRGQGMYPYLTGSGSWLLLTLQTRVFGVRGKNGKLTLDPRLSPSHFDDEGVAQIRCCSVGRELLVRYHNPGKLDFGAYQIGAVRCGRRSLVLPASASDLDEGLTVLDVTLVPKE